MQWEQSSGWQSQRVRMEYNKRGSEVHRHEAQSKAGRTKGVNQVSWKRRTADSVPKVYIPVNSLNL